VHAVTCILKDKDWRTMLALLAPAVTAVWVTNAPSAPAHRTWDLAEVAHTLGDAVRPEPDFARALARACAEAGTVLVCGSFHTVGDAMACLPGFAPIG
jgi:dihydrofolate synthase/folylpolyglutamate synthase